MTYGGQTRGPAHVAGPLGQPSTSRAAHRARRARGASMPARWWAASRLGSPSRLRTKLGRVGAFALGKTQGSRRCGSVERQLGMYQRVCRSGLAAAAARRQTEKWRQEIEPRNRGSCIAARQPSRVARRWSQSLADHLAMAGLSSRASNGIMRSVSIKSRWGRNAIGSASLAAPLARQARRFSGGGELTRSDPFRGGA